MDKQWCVYVHTNMINGKKYVGITCDTKRRWNNGWGYQRNPRFWSAIKHYGWNNFKHEILVENLSFEEATQLEQEYIVALDSKNHGYNMTDGGEGFKGGKLSEESKQKLSEKAKGRKLSEEAKKKLSIIRRGKSSVRKGTKLTNKQKQNISDGLTKYFSNKENRKKRQERNSTKMLMQYDGIIYPSINELARFLGETSDTVFGYISGKYKIPQKHMEHGLFLAGFVPEYEKVLDKSKKVICENTEFQNVVKCAEFYGVNPDTMRSWLSGKAKMRDFFKESNLHYEESFSYKINPKYYFLIKERKNYA